MKLVDGEDRLSELSSRANLRGENVIALLMSLMRAALLFDCPVKDGRCASSGVEEKTLALDTELRLDPP